MAFLHGVEVIQVDNGAVPVTQARSGVIALIGTAPKGPLNTPTIVTSVRQGATLFGSPITGYTIPQALKAIFDQGAGLVVVINVFDPEDTDMVNTVTAESKTVTNGKVTLTYAPIGGPITLTHTSGTPTYTLGTDYTVNDYGVVTVLNFTNIAEGATVKATYDRLDPAGITASVVIGTDTANVRTGLQSIKDIRPMFGYSPGIICVPTYNELLTVAAEMIVLADNVKAMALLDLGGLASRAAAITERGAGQDYNTASKRALLLYPYVQKYDVATDATVNYPFSPFFAGVMAATDNLKGYWFSPSNKELKNVLGLPVNLTAENGDESSDVNLLNAAGIITLFQGFGTGLRTWGNRSAAYPANTTPDVFIPVQRTRDILEISIQEACLQFVDQPITNALIDAVVETINGFINQLVQKGALVDGSCSFNSGDNPVEQIAAGQLVFQVDFMPPPPAERITLNTRIDINLLNILLPTEA